MKILIGLLFIFCSIQNPAQILKSIKDRAVNKAKANTVDKAKSEARNAYHKQLCEEILSPVGFYCIPFSGELLIKQKEGYLIIHFL